jgi:hypothetical protein
MNEESLKNFIEDIDERRDEYYTKMIVKNIASF